MSLSQSAQQLPIPLLQSFPQPVNFQSPSFAGHQIPADPDSSTTSSSSGSSTPLCSNALQRQARQQPMLSASGIDIELVNKELWEKFHRVTNEMVVTRPGRKMFPKLELRLHGLDPTGTYTLSMFMEKVNNFRYKYQAGGWSAAGQDDNGQARSNSVQHQEAWANGKYWTDQERISFDRVKLTNKEIQQGGNTLISLCSMQKYQPVVLLHQYVKDMGYLVVKEFRPSVCQFVAVTAYQSEAVTKLKVEHNPFAKGFREGSSRKRTLSPSPPSTASAFVGPTQNANTMFGQCPAAKRPFALSSPAAAAPFSAFAFPAGLYAPNRFAVSQPTTTAYNWLPSPSATAQLAAVAVAQMAAAHTMAAQNANPVVPSTVQAFDHLHALSVYSNLYQQMLMGGQQQAKTKLQHGQQQLENEEKGKIC